jgi:hypothetical protein
MTLTGLWKLALDPGNAGRAEGWFESPRAEATDVPVPGIIQQVFPAYHGVAWYWLIFQGDLDCDAEHNLQLRFEAVDYFGEVWLNGQLLGSHEGSETPFSLDATAAYRAGAANCLAVRVINTTTERIDGLLLAEVPHCHRAVPFKCGSAFNCGGLTGAVVLRRVPVVRIEDVFAAPDIGRGSFRVRVALRNDRAQAAWVTLSACIGPAATDATSTDAAWRDRLELKPGDSLCEFDLHLPQPRLWELDDPFLYQLTVDLEAQGATAKMQAAAPLQQSYRLRCGLRELRVDRGYFRLNGRRLFLRSTHTTNHFPLGQHVPITPDHLRRDLINAKAAGFNCVRFIAGMAWPEQLDFCDELGLMVYEECLAGWCLGDSPQMGARYDQSTAGMVLRDRNHACVTIWGLLNETPDGPVFRQAVAFLRKLRVLDDSRLVLLGSGRWDCQWSIGSASNPGSAEWEHVWSVEAPGAPAAPFRRDDDTFGAYFQQAGDAHAYPIVPHSDKLTHFIRTLGEGCKPVFLSEYGIGSLMNVVRELRCCEQARAQRVEAGQVVPVSEYEDAEALREMADNLATDWHRLGFEEVYPVLEDMLRDSQRLHVRQRLLGFDLIRANPQLCGYNLTGMLDHGITGEGVWSFWREWKPGILDALCDGWAPLRWCLFLTPLHGYTERPITVEVVLANEDVLPPGDYPVVVRICRQREGVHALGGATPGMVWEKRTTVTVARPAANTDGPLAIPVLKEEITLPGPAGAFELRAYLERGAAPAGGRLVFRLEDAADLPILKAEVLQWGLESRVQNWLTRHGVVCRPFSTHLRGNKPRVILVGEPPESARTQATWRKLVQLIDQGSVAIFLSPAAFKRGDDAVAWLPLVNKGRCYEFSDWLYHKECVARAHPVFEGLQAPGILDWDYWGQVIPHIIFEGQDTPDEVMAAAFAVCHWPAGYAAGTLLGAYKLGAGRIVLNTMRILENLDRHPAADRLLLNLLSRGTDAIVVPKTGLVDGQSCPA